MPGILLLKPVHGNPTGLRRRIMAEHVLGYQAAAGGTDLLLTNQEPLMVKEAVGKVDDMFVKLGHRLVFEEAVEREATALRSVG